MRDNKKKIVIIGGGIAGLSAGIYGKLAGYDVDIYEKNPIAGGQCVGWNRKNCHIDKLEGTDKRGIRKAEKRSGKGNRGTITDAVSEASRTYGIS